MTMPATTITWEHPTAVGMKVILSEEGVNLRCSGEPMFLDQGEVIQLMQLLTEVLELRQSDDEIVPSPPTDEEMLNLSNRVHARRAATAVFRELAGEVAF